MTNCALGVLSTRGLTQIPSRKRNLNWSDSTNENNQDQSMNEDHVRTYVQKDVAASNWWWSDSILYGILYGLFALTHCNTLHDTATYCSTLQNTATHCSTLQPTCLPHGATNGEHKLRALKQQTEVIHLFERLCKGDTLWQKHSNVRSMVLSYGEFSSGLTFENFYLSAPPRT